MKKLYALKENIVRITKLKAFSFILVNILSAQCLFAQQPFIRNFTPTSGVTGTTITIYGYLLTGVKSVSFGGDTAQSVVFINDSTITAIVGLGATGSVSVTTPGGTAQKSGFLFNPQQPVINYFSPTSGTNGTTVTITGRNFTGATAVSFGGTPASFFNVFSDTVINAIVASGATGNIAVTAPGGTGTIAGFIYTIPLPTISSFTPTSAGSGATVTITGTNLTGATAVSFGGVAASSFTTVSSATIKAVVSTGASGSISVTTPGGTAALNGFVFLLPPSISFFTPESGTPGTTIAIHGTHFIGATAVGFGGTPATSFIVVSDSLVTAILANGASGNVTVTTAQGTATAAGFTYIIPPPSVTTFAPFVGGTGTVVTITGTNFTGTTAVSFGGIAATSFFVVSSTTISAQVATGASGNVSVTTAGGTTSLNGFTYVPPPVINSVTPSTAINGDTIIIKGAYFTNATSVSFGGTAAVFTVLSDSEIVATVESGSTGNIVVTTPYGTGSISGFLFLSTPKIISFSPKSGLQGGIITITGISFTGATSVSFGGEAASSFEIISDTIIKATVDTGSSGNITITTPRGTASISGFIFVPNTKIHSFSPSSDGMGATITINGISFTGTSSVSFGGVAALSFKVVSDTVITAITGNGATGSIEISSPQGIATLAGFIFKPLPSITSFAPLSGPIGTIITISGNNFDSVAMNNIVFFGAVRSTVLSATQNKLTVSVPYGATYQPLAVTVRNLTTYSQLPFTVTFLDGGTIDSNSFAQRIDFITGKYPHSIVIADIDGDGKSDLATANFTSNTFSILINNSTTDSISFVAKSDFPSLGGTVNIYAADMDGDGKLDIITLNKANNNFDVFKNKSAPGLISFAPKLSITTSNNPADNPNNITIGDINGDGKPDIIVTSYYAITIFRNISAGGLISLAQGIKITLNNAPFSVSISDLDGDGKADIILSYAADNMISILRNIGNVDSILFSASVNFVTGHNPMSLFTSDIDGDGKIDIVSGNATDNTVSVFLNNSIPGTISLAPKIDFATGTGPVSIYITDLDGDGKPDIALADRNFNSMSILKNTSSIGTISFAPKIDYATETEPNGLAIGDFDGDGRPDIAVTNGGGSQGTTLSVFKNQMIRTPPPVINSFNPDSATSGGLITITGRYFTNTMSVSFGDSVAGSFTVVSDSVITAIVGNGGSGNIIVISSSGSDTISGFKFIEPLKLPVINSFTPDSAGSGGKITINGRNFTGTTSVSFGDTSAISFNLVSDSVITAIVGNGASGSIVVTSSSGSDTISGFKFIEPLKLPLINSFTPDSAGKGIIVTIDGKNFTGAISVRFGDSLAGSFTVFSDSVITAIIGNGASGNIIVTTHDGSDTIGGFIFVSKPLDSSFELIRFGGTLSGNQVQLFWQTKNEETVSSFLIGHGSDSSNFSAIASVKTSGDTGVHYYMFTDSLPQYKNNYYRLTIVDTSGNLSYSNIIVITLNINPQAIRLYPNPAKGYVIVQNPPSSASSNLELVDISGRVVKAIQISPNVVINTLDLGGVAPGIYSVVWTDGARKLTQQLFVN